MMRKKFILGMSLILFTISHAQVGINTDAPTTTLQIDGKDVDSVVSLHTALYTHKVGDTVTLQVVRDGKSQNIKVTLS